MPTAVPPRPTWSARLPRVVVAGEEGMISLVSLFAVMGLLILFGLFANVGKTVSRKLEAQNAADAVAHGAAVEMARGLNAVTTANHLIGELTALCVLHHGLGGDELDDGREPGEDWLSWGAVQWSFWFNAIYGYATYVHPVYDAYSVASEKSKVGGAIRDSRIQLRYALAIAFEAHGAGAGMFWIPWTHSAGVAVMQAARIAQLKILQEYRVLAVLETLARVTAPIKKGILKVGVPALQAYARGVVGMTPINADIAADKIAARNRATGQLYPPITTFFGPRLELPVVREPSRPRDWTKSQLVRATTPWVQYWRKPWLWFGLATLTISGFKNHYEDRTNEYTQTLTDRLRKDNDIRLYVLPGWEPGGRVGKGREAWTKAAGRDQADDLFTVVGFAHRDPPPVTSYGIFRRTNPDGIATYAQAMVYGANPQIPSPGGGLQPRLGWDTLHWASDVHEFPGEDGGWWGLGVADVDEPRIRINWQAKLVPTTRLAESLFWQKGQVRRVFWRTPPWHMNLTGTH